MMIAKREKRVRAVHRGLQGVVWASVARKGAPQRRVYPAGKEAVQQYGEFMRRHVARAVRSGAAGKRVLSPPRLSFCLMGMREQRRRGARLRRRH